MRNSLRIGIAAVVVIVAAVGTVLVLHMLMMGSTVLTKASTPEATAPKPKLTSVSAPDVLVAAYVADATMGDRATAYTQIKSVTPTATSKTVSYQSAPKNSDTPTNNVIVYKASDEAYETNISITDNAQYSLNDTSVHTNSKALDDATNSFLVKKGLVKTSTDSSVKGVTYVNYDSTNVLCQTSNLDGADTAPATYGLACVLKTAINDRYTLLKQLLALYPSSKQLGTPTRVTTGLDTTTGNKRFVSLFATYKTTSKTIYFASLNGTWSYIGDRGVTNPDDASSFSLSDSLKAAIADPKWDGFLTQYIQ